VIKPERAAILPTFPENLKRIARINEDWWVANKPKVLERFEDWLLSG
jgi:putative spermidine/putrescine transport system substrate-binding protein